MKKTIKHLISVLFFLTLVSCQTITTKVDEATKKEEQELSRWIGKQESDLVNAFGKPDRIDFGDTRNRFYVYLSKKYKINCERKFELNKNNMVLGFSSKNCF